jgi:hypothetical protein
LYFSFSFTFKIEVFVMPESNKDFSPAIPESFTPAEIADRVREVESKLAEFVKHKAKDLNIVKITQALQSAPTEVNGETAIAKSCITLKDGRQAACTGFASARRHKTRDTELLSSLAIAKSTANAMSAIESMPDSGQTVIDVSVQHAPMSVPASSAPGKKKEFRHSHNKKISPGQMKLFTSMAQERGLNPYDLAQNHKGKSVGELSSAEVHDLISGLKDNSLQDKIGGYF